MRHTFEDRLNYCHTESYYIAIILHLLYLLTYFSGVIYYPRCSRYRAYSWMLRLKKRKEKDCVLELIMHIPYKQGQLMEAYKTEYIIITDPFTLSITCLIIAFIVYKVASA